ncbi:hypothetical protein ACUULL_003677 [Vibrio cholerae]|uniref:hypothetical protein n=1 Tax=Vibrio cholerae TaxID=666 RepID=UPI00215C11DE|nr:hypothetical protein [Vibrio cholerae]EKF9517700.1 hypothetical protein [Vibrio cholerae]MCR9400004.1 hypothetical protein [Vibrio cholerae]
MTIVEVIDSAIKIGLGATIAWLSTYSLTKLNHSREDEVRAKTRDEEMIIQISGDFGEYIQYFDEYFSRLDSIRTNFELGKLDNKSWELIWKGLETMEHDGRLMKARHKLMRARSTLELLGLKDSSKLVGHILDLEIFMRSYYQVNLSRPIPPQNEFCKKISDEYSKLHDNFYNALHQRFNGSSI